MCFPTHSMEQYLYCKRSYGIVVIDLKQKLHVSPFLSVAFNLASAANARFSRSVKLNIFAFRELSV